MAASSGGRWVWYRIIGNSEPDMVEVSATANVAILKKKIKSENNEKLTRAGVDANDLRVYLSKQHFERDPEQALRPMQKIPSQEKDDNDEPIPFYVHYPPPEPASSSGDQAAEIQQLKRELDIIKATTLDPLYSEAGSSVSKVTLGPESKALVRNKYRNRCAFCDCNEERQLSVAHLVDRNVNSILDREYGETYTLSGPRNGILLCNTGAESCHRQWDDKHLALVPGKLLDTSTTPWKLLVFSTNWKRYADCTSQTLEGLDVPSSVMVVETTFPFHEQHKIIYRRPLAARLRAALAKNMDSIPQSLATYCDWMVELSKRGDEEPDVYSRMSPEERSQLSQHSLPASSSSLAVRRTACMTPHQHQGVQSQYSSANPMQPWPPYIVQQGDLGWMQWFDPASQRYWWYNHSTNHFFYSD